jgi:hypothetical protein
MICEFEHKIFSVKPGDFTSLALDIFRFQYRHNPVYRSFADMVSTDVNSIKLVEQIPFLPISFFKTQEVVCGRFEPEAVFESSGTTQTINSRHYIKDLSLYQKSFLQGFELFYGPVKDWCILALLPSYLERKNSSLVMMADVLIKLSANKHSGFYLYNHEELFRLLEKLEKAGQKTLLLGVSFALLDFAEKYTLPLNHTIVMETGGMKGRREELTREQVHFIIKKSFGVANVHSEYGMTELLSQAYSKADGVFNCPPWMKIVLRDEDDPFAISGSGTGVINIIDLANIYSCSFIASDDAGRLHADGSFEVLGRLDHSDIRGCSLLTVA